MGPALMAEGKGRILFLFVAEAVVHAVDSGDRVLPCAVAPAQAGLQKTLHRLDSRLRGNDGAGAFIRGENAQINNIGAVVDSLIFIYFASEHQFRLGECIFGARRKAGLESFKGKSMA